MTTLNFERTPIGWAFWLRWVLVNITGVVVGIALMFAGVGALLDETPLAVFGAGLGAVFGTTLGIAQWLILRRYLPTTKKRTDLAERSRPARLVINATTLVCTKVVFQDTLCDTTLTLVS